MLLHRMPFEISLHSRMSLQVTFEEMLLAHGAHLHQCTLQASEPTVSVCPAPYFRCKYAQPVVPPYMYVSVWISVRLLALGFCRLCLFFWELLILWKGNLIFLRDAIWLFSPELSLPMQESLALQSEGCVFSSYLALCLLRVVWEFLLLFLVFFCVLILYIEFFGLVGTYFGVI